MSFFDLVRYVFHVETLLERTQGLIFTSPSPQYMRLTYHALIRRRHRLLHRRIDRQQSMVRCNPGKSVSARASGWLLGARRESSLARRRPAVACLSHACCARAPTWESTPLSPWSGTVRLNVTPRLTTLLGHTGRGARTITTTATTELPPHSSPLPQHIFFSSLFCIYRRLPLSIQTRCHGKKGQCSSPLRNWFGFTAVLMPIVPADAAMALK